MSRKSITTDEKVEYLNGKNIDITNLSEDDINSLFIKEKQKELSKKKKNQKVSNSKTTTKKKKTIAIESIKYTPFEKASDMVIEIDDLVEEMSYDELSRFKIMINGLLDNIEGDLKEKREIEKERLIAKLNALGYEEGLDF